jgi:hypothetical protein
MQSLTVSGGIPNWMLPMTVLMRIPPLGSLTIESCNLGAIFASPEPDNLAISSSISSLFAIEQDIRFLARDYLFIYLQ